MCKVCTEAVHSVALETRVTLQGLPFRGTLNMGYNSNNSDGLKGGLGQLNGEVSSGRA